MKRGLLLLILLLLPARVLRAQQASARIRVVATQINVRAAPEGTILGTLPRGALVDLTGTNADRSWGYFMYWDKPAWITGSPAYIQIVSGDWGALPVIGAQVALTEYAVIPDIPEPGQPFTIRLTLRSSQNVGAFQVAGDCADFALLSVPRLAADNTQALDLHCPGDPATGVHSMALVIDTDQQVSSGQKREIIYFIDRLYSQSAMDWPAFSDLNLDGGKYDLAWDGVEIIGLNGAQLFAMPDESLATIHYDRLTAQKTMGRLPSSGSVFGIITAEKQRAALEVIAERGDHLHIEFRIYPEPHS